MSTAAKDISYLVKKSDVYQVAWEMLREHQVDIVASLGDTALLGGVHAWNDNDWNPTAERIQSIIYSGVQAVFDPEPDKAHADVEVEPSYKNLWGVVTLKFAKELLFEVAKEMAEKVADVGLETAVAAVERKLGHSIEFQDATQGRQRWEIFQKRYGVRMKVARNAAVRKLCKQVLPKYSSGKRKGIQIISTRKLSVPLGFSMFSGKPCYRAGRGGQSLPEGVWLKRYRARRRKQRKDPSRKYSMAKRSKIKIPVPTKNPRPLHVMDLRPSKTGKGSFYNVTEDSDTIYARVTEGDEDAYLA